VRFALAVSEMLKIEKEVALKALNQFEPERMKVFEWRGKTIIDDAYNANPTSFNKSLEYLFSKRGRKALVIGRMLELGIYEKEYEKKLFEIIFKGKPSLVIAKGGFAESIPQNWIKMNDENEIYGYLERHIDSFDILLLKGSHKTEVYKIANLLRGGV
jgi:UDP-N-acetylmuramoyl-tripeptide--D-alanyl-D-alanine ligase